MAVRKFYYSAFAPFGFITISEIYAASKKEAKRKIKDTDNSLRWITLWTDQGDPSFFPMFL